MHLLARKLLSILFIVLADVHKGLALEFGECDFPLAGKLEKESEAATWLGRSAPTCQKGSPSAFVPSGSADETFDFLVETWSASSAELS